MSDAYSGPTVILTDLPAVGSQCWCYDASADVLTVSRPRVRELLGREPRDDDEVRLVALGEYLSSDLPSDGEG